MQQVVLSLLKDLTPFLPVPISPNPHTQASSSLSTTDIPSYALEYAPLVWLHSQDAYRPSDISQQVVNTIPKIDETAIDAPSPLNLDNLDELNEHDNGTSVFLSSKNGIDAPQPEWMFGNAPDSKGRVDGTASVIVTREVSDEEMDVFYFYFYAYNQGNTVLGMEFGDHIGDWEHNMIRFKNGTPQAVWYSQHASGQAFTYAGLEKQGQRPYAYSGNGTHAVYATPGSHDHTIPSITLPAGPLVDKTDRGLLWDPTLNAYAYRYDNATQRFQPYDDQFPLNWLDFNGHWGDDALPGGPVFFGEAKYTGGPTGPKDKALVREEVCPSKPCVVLPFRV